MDFDINLLPPCDVLVLGAGLAGLRAAWAALATVPGAAVAVVSPWPGPSGSSFANRDGRLALCIPTEDAARQDFCRRVMALGRPGIVREELVTILAAEASARCRELRDSGVRLTRETRDDAPGQASTEAPDSRQTILLDDLPGTYETLRCNVASLGGRFLPGLNALALLRDPAGGPVRGALVEDYAGRRHAFPARTTIAAMGGTAGLWLYNLAGRGGSGFGHGLLAAAGAAMANTAFMQWRWVETATKRCWPIERLGMGAAVHDPATGRSVPLPGTADPEPPGLQDNPQPRRVALSDADLNRFVLEKADALGVARVTEGQRAFEVALVARAANGGALITARGETDIPGLYAVGECATGMHGANCPAGSMAAACLVFGARAGQAAAMAAQKDSGLMPGDIRRMVCRDRQACHRDMRQRGDVRRVVADALQRFGLPRADAATEALVSRLVAQKETVVDAGAARLVDAALCFAQGKAALEQASPQPG